MTSSSGPSSPTSYDGYRSWKGWDRQRRLAPWLRRYFQKEFQRAGIASPGTVLEVGFGDGSFLEWAKEAGFEVVGVEIISELVEDRRSEGFEVHHCDLTAEHPSWESGEPFDAVIAFDVIEHLTVEQIHTFLKRIAAMLKPGGRLLIRFPNGESPFGFPIYNGDHTHRTLLTRSKLTQLSMDTGLTVEGYFNAARVANKQSTALLKQALFALRSLTEIVVGYTYFNQRRPLDAVATAVLRRKSEVGDRKTVIGFRKSEVGGRWAEVVKRLKKGRKSEIG